MDDDQQFCLRWNNHQSTLVAVFDTLLENGTLVDCTLAAEGKYLNAHKVVLSACSPYFEALLSKHFDKHPIVVLKDVKFQELKAMMDYMYRGEVNISQDQLGALLKAAESLQIKGLSDNKRGETERKPVLAAPTAPKSPPPAPVAAAAALPKVQGLTIEQRRDDSREGSASPGPRKKKRLRRRSDDLDNHDASNSSESHSLPASAQNAATPAKMTSEVPEPVESKADVLTRHKQPPADEVATMPVLKEKLETHSELMLEPKSEYVDEMNEDSIEDLTLDDDDLSNMEQMDDQAGPSHGNAGEGSSQGFGGWHMGNQSQDEVFLAAQEAVGAHRDSQGAIKIEISDIILPSIDDPPPLVKFGSSSLSNTSSLIRRIEELETESDFANKRRTVTSQSKIMISPENLLDHLLGVSEGKEIIRYYKMYNCLNDSYRKKLVNLSVDYLTKFFDRNSMPSTYSREELAKSIIFVFPKLKDPDSPKGYEAFYEPASQKGFITTRLRTIIRKRNAELEGRKKIGNRSDEIENSSQVSEQESMVELMKDKDGSKDAAEIYEITRRTFWYRKKTGCDYNKYPRFLDTKGLMSLEFEMLHPNAKKLSDTFPMYINKIFEVYQRTLHSKSDEIINDHGDDAWTKLVRAFFCILQILPPTARGRNKETKISAQKHFVQFQKFDVPLGEIMNTKVSTQPFLLAVGPSKKYCEQYYLVFYDRIIPISSILDGEQSFLAAVDVLMKTHFVYNIEYNVNLKIFFDFISTFFYEINEGITITSRMRELRCKLKN